MLHPDQKNKMFLVSPLHSNTFIFHIWPTVIGLICVSALIILQSESITGAWLSSWAELSFFPSHLTPTNQKCAPGSHWRIASALQPHRSIPQSSVSFTCSFFEIWLYRYTKHIHNQCVRIFKYPVNPSTLNVEGSKWFQQAYLTSIGGESVKLKLKSWT